MFISLSDIASNLTLDLISTCSLEKRVESSRFFLVRKEICSSSSSSRGYYDISLTLTLLKCERHVDILLKEEFSCGFCYFHGPD